MECPLCAKSGHMQCSKKAYSITSSTATRSKNKMFNTHYQVMDIENEPIAWDPSDHNVSFPWGMPARQAWYEEATLFEGATVSEPAVKPQPLTLEKFLSDGTPRR